MSDLEKEIASVETDAIVEEQYNADNNYASLDNELKSIIANIPYPETERFTTGRDYEEIDRINLEKKINEPHWKLRDKAEKYCNNGSLYSGHLHVNNSNYYFMEGRLAETKNIEVNGDDVWFINTDDKIYDDLTNCWRYPSGNKDVQFSRNITMDNRKVLAVDIILDRGSELFANISDAYLRKALIRNKEKSGVQSIIQTIQKKQNSIRSLPKERSFIVQGCAGSGKTMVLLHRLRYLLYNKEIRNDEYVFLIPSKSFKEFIDGFSAKFNINQRNIFSYQEYYQEIIGKKPKSNDADISELVFASEYLERVYSKSFMQESYRGIFDLLSKQTDSLIEFFEGKLNELLEFEKLLLEEEFDITIKNAIKESTEVTQQIQQFISVRIENKYDNISVVLSEIEETYKKRKSEYDTAINPDINISISPDDERILSNETLATIRNSIEAEQNAIKNASVFTVSAHTNKLLKLQEKYDTEYKRIESELIIEDKKKRAEQALKLVYVYEGISLTEVEAILETLKSILAVSDETLADVQSKLDNINAYLREKFSKEIESLTKLITVSGDMANDSSAFIDELAPSYAFFEKNINIGVELINSFKEHINSTKEKDYLKNTFPLFSNRSQNQLYAYLNQLLFNSCKRKLSHDFSIKICDMYKHYWYLLLYCNYLTRPLKSNNKKYIFIDEAQDLSISEIELIHRINSINGKPVFNLFGDTNQMITTHGVKDWSLLKMVHQVYTLEENFRNTNQVIDYCNEKLSVQMVKVGVDMAPVNEYNTIKEAIAASNILTQNAVFVVKDDYSVSDLKELLSHTQIKTYEIYTVKSVKGLEFKEVVVFDSDMSLNEKYIAYTRALAKLTVIKTLPATADRKVPLIVEGTETEEVEPNSETATNMG